MGTWTPVATLANRTLDAGAVYASKDFYDPVHKRRIMWGWAHEGTTPVTNAQTLPRVVSWHPVLGHLVFAPLPELSALRMMPPLSDLEEISLVAEQARSLGNWSRGQGNQSEVIATFKFPPPDMSANVTFGVGMMATDGHPAVEAFVSWISPPGSQGPWYALAGVGGFGACRGLAPRAGDPGCSVANLTLLPSDTEVRVHVFMDQHFCEVYFMGGRVVVTKPVTAHSDQARFSCGRV